MTDNVGKIVQIEGCVVDVAFPEAALPHIKEMLRVTVKGSDRVMEVAKHVGGGVARCVMLDPSEGLCRGLDVVATGETISVPVGEEVLGRLFNVLGETIDGGADLPEGTRRASIYRDPPSFADRPSDVDVLETGIKVIDLLAPYAKGGKIGLFGGAGVGKTVLIQEL
ncbi:MAG: F0F1 ATP synthase subunit beta, partial [Clostridia bacterium]|nr:F0F1 ATP synthase subunit beta [Clostridia bacterium]